MHRMQNKRRYERRHAMRQLQILETVRQYDKGQRQEINAPPFSLLGEAK